MYSYLHVCVGAHLCTGVCLDYVHVHVDEEG